jgi:MoxR-like ATPase
MIMETETTTANMELPEGVGTLSGKFRMVAAEICAIYPERVEHVDILLSCRLARVYPSLVSAPGTGKSSMIREIMGRFGLQGNIDGSLAHGQRVFNSGLRATDIFGNINPKHMMETGDETVNSKGRLVMAENQFWDEAGKSSVEMLSCLLSLANEGYWENGPQTIRSPIQWACTASNETFPMDAEAMQDRFPVRMPVLRLQDPDNRFALAMGRVGTRKGEVVDRGDTRTLLSGSDLSMAMVEKDNVSISESLGRTITEMVETRIASEDGEFVSTRAAVEWMPLLQAYAWLQGCDEIRVAHATKVLPYLMVNAELGEKWKIVAEDFLRCQSIVTEELMADIHELEMNVTDLERRMSEVEQRVEENAVIGGDRQSDFKIVKEMKTTAKEMLETARNSGRDDLAERCENIKTRLMDTLITINMNTKKRAK